MIMTNNELSVISQHHRASLRSFRRSSDNTREAQYGVRCGIKECIDDYLAQVARNYYNILNELEIDISSPEDIFNRLFFEFAVCDVNRILIRLLGFMNMILSRIENDTTVPFKIRSKRHIQMTAIYELFVAVYNSTSPNQFDRVIVVDYSQKGGLKTRLWVKDEDVSRLTLMGKPLKTMKR